MKNYLELLKNIYENGEDYGNRTAYVRRSLSHGPRSLHYDLREGFPLPTTARTNTKAIFEELRWFLSGSTNINDLDCKIWDEWANKHGDIGPMYGACFRNWNGNLDQLEKIVSDIEEFPNASDLVMTTWNPETVPSRNWTAEENVHWDKQALANCHGTVIQFFVRDGYLDMTTYQRSADFPVGVRFNLASYAMLHFLVAAQTDLKVRYMDYLFGDAHIYHNQFPGVKEMLSRTPSEHPVVVTIPSSMGIWNFDPTLVVVGNYFPEPAIDFGKIAV